MPCGILFHMITFIIVRVETDNLFHPDSHGHASLLHSFTVFLGQGNLPQPSEFILPLWAFPWQYISIALWTYYCGNSLVDLSSVSPLIALFLACGSLNFSLFLKGSGSLLWRLLLWSGSFFSHVNWQNANTARSAFQSWQQSPEISLLTSDTPLLLTTAILCLHVYWAGMRP